MAVGIGAFLAPGTAEGDFAAGGLPGFAGGIFTTEDTEETWAPFSDGEAWLKRDLPADFRDGRSEDSASTLISGAGSAFFFPAWLLRFQSSWFSRTQP